MISSQYYIEQSAASHKYTPSLLSTLNTLCVAGSYMNSAIFPGFMCYLWNLVFHTHTIKEPMLQLKASVSEKSTKTINGVCGVNRAKDHTNYKIYLTTTSVQNQFQVNALGKLSGIQKSWVMLVFNRCKRQTLKHKEKRVNKPPQLHTHTHTHTQGVLSWVCNKSALEMLKKHTPLTQSSLLSTLCVEVLDATLEDIRQYFT